MISQEIRRRFLHYFKSQDHSIVPSAPVIPHDDPTLLFVNAGMNQFKDVFLGKSKRSYKRAATTQKCIRVGGKHNDIENVGHTKRHLTFFEMLGNFSFGDYFKEKAIGFAWDVSTHIFDFDPKKIWASVYNDDDEAFALWEKHLPTNRIVRFGEEENFWSMGDTGPCGPCSELLYDRGPAYGDANSPLEDVSGERYLEFWNLVFMEFNRDELGKMDPLPRKSIDTGAGIERIVALKMDVDTVFQTDILRSLISEIETICGKKYEPTNHDLAACFNVIADHIRTLAFAIADGVQPSNIERGYVLRKVLRRAVRYGRNLEITQPFLAGLLPKLTEMMGEDFPELHTARNRIEEILTLEEEAFLRTLKRGGNILHNIIYSAQKEKRQISGEESFKLKDTYGFPLEEILLLAKDAHLEIDMKRFQELELEAKEKSRNAQKLESQQFDENIFNDFTRTHKPCEFLGYTETEVPNAKVVALIFQEQFVDQLSEGQEGFVILDRSPFYAEMGGQAGDTGTLHTDGDLFRVQNCVSPYAGVVTHVGKVEKGKLLKGHSYTAKIDTQRRILIQNNHTATHLLHWALQRVLGEHIRQAGSVVDPNRLRFDFTHHKGVTFEEVRQIEDLINDKIREDRDVATYTISYDEAQKCSEIKQFFGEKYGEQVRVIDIDYSKELCGGTHTDRLGTIGLFKIAKESSIAAGVRRIEALTGRAAEDFVQKQEDHLLLISSILKAPTNKLIEKARALMEENKELQQKVKSMRTTELKGHIVQLMNQVEKVGPIALIAQEVKLSFNELNSFAEEVMNHFESGVLALGVKTVDRCQLLIRVSPDLIEKGIHADAIIKEVAPLIEGGGGGKKASAQAGGKDPTGMSRALQKIRNFLENAK